MKRRVVITGVGGITPVGCGVAAPFAALVNGKSGISKITAFDAGSFPSKIAGEVKPEHFQPESFLTPKEIKRTGRFIQFALAAADLAIKDAGLEVEEAFSHQIGAIVGVGLGGLEIIEKSHDRFLEKGARRISPYMIPMLVPNMAASMIAMRHKLKGPNFCISSACASGAHALGSALWAIQRGDAEIIVAGGAEATITPLGLGGFCAMKALSRRNEAPEQASRPFDLQRDGFVIAEGAEILICESLDSARRRGARIRAEFAGCGATSDAYHVTAPDPEGLGASACMAAALADAKVNREEVDYINAHGTSTTYNDTIETKAIKNVFKAHAAKLKISATKSMLGHMLGAAGAVEAMVCVLAIEKGVMPPTINYEYPDPECDLDYIPNQAREMPIAVAMSNSLGFGGTNTSLVFKAFKE